jgi:cation-transporting ATPase 13A1
MSKRLHLRFGYGCQLTRMTCRHSRGTVDLKAEYKPSLLNTSVYLLGLSQQVSTFVINFQGRPFREGIRENPPLYYGLAGVSAIAFAGATEFSPELNSWLQLFKMESWVSYLASPC